ncbi:hypothetical protein P7C73_g4488, partial [Tremellales sp. Uapishka_1]
MDATKTRDGSSTKQRTKQIASVPTHHHRIANNVAKESTITLARTASSPPSYAVVQMMDNENNLASADVTAITAPTTFRTKKSSCCGKNRNVMPIIDDIDCEKQGHKPKRTYGAVGIAAGIVFFPWGLFWTRCDSELVCKECRTVLVENHYQRKRRHGRCAQRCGRGRC